MSQRIASTAALLERWDAALPFMRMAWQRFHFSHAETMG